ncbi:hypothetical protein F1737_04400 [Methanoplanus sp. FWC-SCC4]|uniref:Uncharacterized protein n=1 Tax=Methanochimaera problematica TaxID=2609417 RepID=A0AA97FEK3_9EURY|nr:hypothetical protein [Methanoplanus sp. FWC-SCC4]WOF15996.1 hypothetical protein F1737_04400 [Methanoplanus sp. FWC-SCC4]
MSGAALTQSNLPEGIREKIREDATAYDPLLRRLDMVQVLGRDPDNTFTELSDDEAIEFGILESLHNSDVIKLDGVMIFFQLLKRNRVALDRKGTDEYIKALVGQINGQIQPHTYYASPGTVEQEKTGIMDRIMFWRKD